MVIDLPRYAPTVEDEICGDRKVTGQTYLEQFKEVEGALLSGELSTSRPLPKPRPGVATDRGAKRIPFTKVCTPVPHRPLGCLPRSQCRPCAVRCGAC